MSIARGERCGVGSAERYGPLMPSSKLIVEATVLRLRSLMHWVRGHRRLAATVLGLAALCLPAWIMVRDEDRTAGDWLEILIGGPIAGLVTFAGLYAMFLLTKKREDDKDRRARSTDSALEVVTELQNLKHVLTEEPINAAGALDRMYSGVLARFRAREGREHSWLCAWLEERCIDAMTAYQESTPKARKILNDMSVVVTMWVKEDFNSASIRAVEDARSVRRRRDKPSS